MREKRVRRHSTSKEKQQKSHAIATKRDKSGMQGEGEKSGIHKRQNGNSFKCQANNFICNSIRDIASQIFKLGSDI